MKKSFGAPNPPIHGSSQFTMSCWLRSDEPYPARTLVAGFGDLTAVPRAQRYFALLKGRPALWLGLDGLAGFRAFSTGEWHHVALTFDGATARLYADGAEVAAAPTSFWDATPLIELAPPAGRPWSHFGGRIAYFRVANRVLAPAEIRAMQSEAVALEALTYEPGSKPWPVAVERSRWPFGAPGSGVVAEVGSSAANTCCATREVRSVTDGTRL